MTHKQHLKDTTLRWLYKAYKAEQDELPEEERVGFRVWCRRSGILTPAQQDQIARTEVPFKEQGYEEDED